MPTNPAPASPARRAHLVEKLTLLAKYLRHTGPWGPRAAMAFHQRVPPMEVALVGFDEPTQQEFEALRLRLRHAGFESFDVHRVEDGGWVGIVMRTGPREEGVFGDEEDSAVCEVARSCGFSLSNLLR